MKLRLPDLTTVCLENQTFELTDSLSFDGGFVSYELTDRLNIKLKSEKQGVRFVWLRWNESLRKDVKILGDAWERGYGDLEWRSVDPARRMPWYMAISNGTDSVRNYADRLTECFGVGVLPNALAQWLCDENSITLCLDVRNGCACTYLGTDILDCATVFFKEYETMSAFSALKNFCHVMSPAPLLADHVVYGSNNWYYAYGRSSHEEILSDSRFVKEMCTDADTIPYMVIDDGWQPNSVDAPWHIGNDRFPDMKRLAEEMKAIGVRPGIWVRYLVNGRDDEPRKVDTFPEEWYSQRCSKTLDPSHPGVLNYVAETTRRFIDWGYTLIKHDFSTYDIFGKWGFEFGEHMADGNWCFHDRNKTTAQIIKNLYRTILDAANGALIIGCNAIGHLCAGLHHFNRTGDDTSGYEWARTRKMGVNTLAFRLVQNNAFYGADADCVGITGEIDWKHNRQWLKLLSLSASPFFVSCKPNLPSDSEMQDLKTAFSLASRASDELIPLDWMETVTPQKYLLNGEEILFHWDD
ncbi:MAG: hypothetical protein E7487_11270 [Ruminococcaceae bacterium]|nr:hypothetical protein [Oscillospiraceae bacterium]